MTYSILSEALVRPSVAPRQPPGKAYSTIWDQNLNLQGWTSFFNMDIVGAWGGFLFGTKLTASGSSIGPASNFAPIDTLSNNLISFRMKYDKHPRNTNTTSFGKVRWITQADSFFDDTKSQTFTLIPDGKWHIYEINVGQNPQWVGLVNNVQLFPGEDGARNDEFFLSYFDIGSTNFSFSFSNSLAGSPGSVTGGLPLTNQITIQKDFNDKLLININNYGFVQIVLTAQTGSPQTIARDISFQLGKIALGGYVRAFASIDPVTNLLHIQSGTFASDSTVQVQNSPASAAPILGLTAGNGAFIGTSVVGTDPDPSYVPLSTYKPTTLEILALFDNDTSLQAFSLNPQQFVVEGGREDYAITDQQLSTTILAETTGTGFQGQTIQVAGYFDFRGNTVIDVNHPFTDDGIITKIATNGVMDTTGNSKWKIFRPSLNGNLTLIAEGVIGQTTIVPNPNNGLVLTISPGPFVTDVSGQNIRVRRGDLLGLFNGQLNVGLNSTQRVDALYYLIPGDAEGTFTPPPPSGAGESGLPIYARGDDTKKIAVLDIDLGRRLNVDSIGIFGNEAINDLEYNVATSASASFSATIPGTHIICYVINVSTGLRQCDSRNNLPFNLQALNDNVLYADNGISSFGSPGTPGGSTGQGGATVAGATYFYVNGDGEFMNVYEYQNRNPMVYNFIHDPLTITCFFNSSTPRLDKPIGKAVIYFKEKKNQRSWQIEYPIPGNNGNGSSSGFNLIPASSISSVKIDKLIITNYNYLTIKSSSTSTILLNNPVNLTTVADGQVQTIAPVTGHVNVVNNILDQTIFIDFQWTRFEWNFTPIRTTGFQWFCPFHWSTKISEFQIFALSSASEAIGDNAQILFSADGQTFTTAKLLSSANGEVQYQIGNSPRFLRILFRPTINLEITELAVSFEQGTTAFGPKGRLLSATIDDAREGTVGAATPIVVTNTTGQTSDLFVDIGADATSARQLLYFNKLHTASGIIDPDFGPPGKIDFTPNKILQEMSNVAINATSYGLLDLSGFNSTVTTPNLIQNPGFETGTPAPWILNITQSGTLPFQVPGVISLANYSNVFSFQRGNFVLGFYVDELDPHQIGNSVSAIFDFQQTIDLTSYASNISNGGVTCILTFPFIYIDSSTGTPNLFVTEAPTVSGLSSPAQDAAHFFSLQPSSISPPPADQNSFTTTFTLKQTTRVINIHIFVNSLSFRTGSFPRRQGALFDAFSLTLSFPGSSRKWYKSWRTGSGDFVDSSYSPVTVFTTITGSTHWWQPFNTSQFFTSGPGGGQVRGFSNALSFSRTQVIQSFRAMTPTDPGILGAAWAGEKTIVGVRVAFSMGVNISAPSYPFNFHIDTLRRQSDLGVTPDLNNPNHFQTTKHYSSLPSFTDPTQFHSLDPTHIPIMRILTFLFDAPVITTGFRLMFTLNCDSAELNSIYAGNGPAMVSGTGCPPTFSNTFNSNYGLGASMVHALESLGNSSVPIDNVREADQTSITQTYAAIDLGRHFAITTDPVLFELIATTPDQTEWSATAAVYSSSSTSNPNAVSWGNTTSSFARWIRFPSTAVNEMEYSIFQVSSGTVNTLPQAILTQSRIYPDITVSQFPVEGYNSTWVNLGKVLSDNDPTTFIYYSDYPVIAMDFGNSYYINNDTNVPQNNHVVDAGSSATTPTDKRYWLANSENYFSYASNTSNGISRPEQVSFSAFGAGVPVNSIRWAAVKGTANLLQSAASGPKTFNFRTPGQLLSNVSFAPLTSGVPLPIPTDNANWFTTQISALQDISTVVSTIGLPYSYRDGVDFGANSENIGPAVNAFDGQFQQSQSNYWGVSARSLFAGQQSQALAFPHNIWRIFRDPYRGAITTQEVAAVFILGYSALFYPTTFQIQSFITGSVDPTLDSSWQNIAEANFTNVNTWQNGNGFRYVFATPVFTQGIRIVINNSVFPDDSSTQSSLPQGTNIPTGISGPQTRVGQIVIYANSLASASIQGEIDINHAEFATVTSLNASPGQPITNINDNNISTYWQSPSFTETVTIHLPAPAPITKFVWEVDPNLGKQSGQLSTNAPSTFTLSALINGSPVQVLSASNYVGTSFSGTLGGVPGAPPVTSDTFIFQINQVQAQFEGANSVQVSEVLLIEQSFQSVPLVTVTGIQDRHPGGINQHSTQITYAANSHAKAIVSLAGMNAGNDVNFSERDFFSIWMNINDTSLMDTSFGSISIGNSSQIFYSWNLSSVTLKNGWNQYLFQFSKAANKSPIPFQPGPQYNPNTGFSRVDFITGTTTFTTAVDGSISTRTVEAPGIRFFQIEFRGLGGASPLIISLDDIEFVRNNFSDTCHFASSLYLNNDELFTLYSEGIDLAAGTIEFWVQPDWDSAAQLTPTRSIVPCFFRVIRPDNTFLSLIYRPSEGFVAIINDGTQSLQFASDVTLYPFNRFDTFHFALAWDSSGGVGNLNATLAMYVNGLPVFGSPAPWTGIREGGSTVLIGGEAGQRISAPPLNSSVTTFTPVGTQPLTNTQSCWALLENIKIYNYPKTDFSDRLSPNLTQNQLIQPSQLIQVSLDNVNFYNIGSTNLPLVQRGILNGKSATIYVRTNIPKGLTGRESRDASLLVRWKVPQCS